MPTVFYRLFCICLLEHAETYYFIDLIYDSYSDNSNLGWHPGAVKHCNFVLQKVVYRRKKYTKAGRNLVG